MDKLASVKILLVEDEQAHAFLIKSALSDGPYELTHVARIGEALESLMDDMAHLILSDLNLDDAKGVETVVRLRKVAAGTPIVVLTASTSLHDAVEAMRAGAEDFVIKEFDENFSQVLRFSVDRALDRRWAEEEQQRLKREREWLERAIEYSHDGLAVVKDGVCTYSNSAFRNFSGVCGLSLTPFGEVDGSKVKQASRLEKMLFEALSQERREGVSSIEVVPTMGEADETYGLTISSPPLDFAGSEPETSNSIRIVWVRDISEQKRRERFQRDMLSAASHDLKGPLSAISLSSDLLGQVQSDTKKEEIRLRIASLAKSCQNLVEELLSADSLRAGALVVRLDSVLVKSLVLQVLDEFQPVAKSRQITLQLRDKECEDIRWSLDSLAFVRILSNLVSNGIKYSSKGGMVEVGIDIQDDHLHVAVRDSGKGIDPSRVSKIFQRYSRLERDLKESGHGLGLFVTKGLVSAHGGSISVDSVVGEGSCFTVMFPGSELSPTSEKAKSDEPA